MANPIIKIKRGVTAPATTLNAGEFAIDQAAKNLYLGIEEAGVVSNVIVGGEGTFATKTYVDNAVSAGTGALGTMSTQNANNVAITGGSISGVSLNVTAPIIDLQGGSLINVPGPTNASDPANKFYVDAVVSNLGSVFRYVGDVSSATTPLDLSTLSNQSTGAYYRVDVAGTYTAGTDSFAAKVGDAFVKTTTGWQKLDNVDAVVSGTANEITVNGDENVGYTVSIDPVFSGRMTTAEGDITALEGRATDLEAKTQNIDIGGTTAGTTQLNGTVSVGAPAFTGVGVTIKDDGSIKALSSGGDAYFDVSYFNGITLGAQNNPLLTVNIRNGLVGVDHYMYGMPSIQNFVIDGGVY